MADTNNLDRRGFVSIVLAFVGTIMSTTIGIPAIGYLISPATKVRKAESWVSLGPLENYSIGKPTLFSFTRTTINGWEKTVNSYGAYVIRFSADQVKVFSNLCTHLSCRVSWKEDQNHYVCPCHDAQFDLEGKVTAGPPPRSLDGYQTKIEDGNLSILVTEG